MTSRDRRPDGVRSMPTAEGDELLEGTVTIGFVDVEGSTGLVQRIGDEDYIEIIRFLDHTTADLAAAARGHIPRHEGDGWMVVFGSARRAVRWAIDVQRRMLDAPSVVTDNGVRVRIGLHTGEAIQSGRDFLGVHINMAARIADQAAGGEIVVSAITNTVMEGSAWLRVGEPRICELKGFTEPVFVFPVDWTDVTDRLVDDAADAADAADVGESPTSVRGEE